MPTTLPSPGAVFAEVVVGHDVDGSAFVGEVMFRPADRRFVGACGSRDLEIDAPTLAGALLLAHLRYPDGVELCAAGLEQLANEAPLAQVSR